MGILSQPSHPHCSVSSVLETPPATATMKPETAREAKRVGDERVRARHGTAAKVRARTRAARARRRVPSRGAAARTEDDPVEDHVVLGRVALLLLRAGRLGQLLLQRLHRVLVVLAVGVDEAVHDGHL